MSAQDGYGPTPPAGPGEPGEPGQPGQPNPGPEVTPATDPGTPNTGATGQTTVPGPTTVQVAGTSQTQTVDAPLVRSSQSLPVTGGTVFPVVATGVGLVAVGLLFRRADSITAIKDAG